MPNQSKQTQVVSIRLPNEIIAIISRRVNGKKSRCDSMGEYLRGRIIYDVTRRHHKRGIDD